MLGSAHDLELNGLALKLNSSDLEVDADGGDVGLGVGVVCETQQEAGFTDARVTYSAVLAQRHSPLCQFNSYQLGGA